MDAAKVKIKIGPHEFEAEGTQEMVQAQFDAFRQMISTLPAPVTTAAADSATVSAATTDGGGNVVLAKIMTVEDRIVSLTVRGDSLEDEIALVLLGQKLMRSNDSVTGGEIMDGLRLTGRTVNRIDYQMDKMTDGGDVITIGVGRARRYRLTNKGSAKAQELARTLIATVA